jgi:transposase-like protein
MGNKFRSQKGQHLADLTEEQARTYLEGILWPNGAVCAHCQSKDVYKMQGKSCRPGLWRCRGCKKQFTVTIGTLFEDSHIPLRKWLRAFHLMASSKKGISALQLQRNLGLGSYEAAWHMAHRIRRAMQCSALGDLFKGTVEVDEVYLGGKNRGKGWAHTHDNKMPVVSLVEREGEGRKRSFVLRHVTGKKLVQMVKENVEPYSFVNTDESPNYKGMRKAPFQHHSVNHHEKEYARRLPSGRLVTTNTVESSFALLRRGIIGVFHQVSRQHLHRYCAEFDFRWNHRKVEDVERARRILSETKGKRLTYKNLVGNVA